MILKLLERLLALRAPRPRVYGDRDSFSARDVGDQAPRESWDFGELPAMRAGRYQAVQAAEVERR